MARMTVKATLAEDVHDQLRSELLRGTRAPGSKLLISDIATQYEVSPSVVREALTRLAEQGLAVALPQRGFTVMELSIEDLVDLTRARRLVETIALRESIADGDLDWESAVLGAHHRLRRTAMVEADGHIRPEWAEAHRDFHHVLLAGGKSIRLTAIADSLRDCSELYIHWSRELAHDERRNVSAEHQQIADLTLARAADEAAEALAKHIERTTEALIRYANTLDDEAERQVG
jgi:DNA-binding GntR family transcriptional regulator